jgi:hypothetical protein
MLREIALRGEGNACAVRPDDVAQRGRGAEDDAPAGRGAEGEPVVAQSECRGEAGRNVGGPLVLRAGRALREQQHRIDHGVGLQVHCAEAVARQVRGEQCGLVCRVLAQCDL